MDEQTKAVFKGGTIERVEKERRGGEEERMAIKAKAKRKRKRREIKEQTKEIYSTS